MQSVQNLIVWLVVGGAALYLGRHFWTAWRGLWQSKSGCATGCGNCAFAQQTKAGKSAPVPASRPGLIALSDVRTLPRRNTPPTAP